MNVSTMEERPVESRGRSSDDYESILRKKAGIYFPELAEVANLQVAKQWEHKRSNSEVYEFLLSADGIGRSVIVKVPVSQRFWDASVAVNEDPESDRPRTTPRPDPLEKGAHEYEGLRAIRAYFSSLGDDRFDTIRPLELLTDPHVLIMEKGPSQDLLGYLRRVNRFQRRFVDFDIEESFARAGNWLRLFHRMPLPTHTRERSTRADDFLHTCRSFWELLLELGESDRMIESMRRRFIAGVERHLPDDFELGITHGDYAPRNILVDTSSKLTVFDTQARWHAPIYEDIAHFLVAVKASGAQVSSKGLWFSKHALSRFEHHFLGGYFEHDVPLPTIRLFECQRLLEWWSSLIFRHHRAKGIKKLLKGSRAFLWRGSLISYLEACLRDIE